MVCYKYNDYVKLVREYLRNYNRWHIAVQNMQEEIEAKQREIAVIAAPVAKYGNTTGGVNELTSVEREASMHEQARQDISSLERGLATLRRKLAQLERAIHGLQPEEQELLRRRYIDGGSWLAISGVMHVSPDWARKRARRALGHVAGMIFGSVAEQQALFTFVS